MKRKICNFVISTVHVDRQTHLSKINIFMISTVHVSVSPMYLMISKTRHGFIAAPTRNITDELAPMKSKTVKITCALHEFQINEIQFARNKS